MASTRDVGNLMMKGYNARQDEIVVRCRGLADWYYGCWCHTDSRLTLACLRIRHTQDTLRNPWEGMDGDHACEPLSSFPSISQRMIMATSGKARQHRAVLRLCRLHPKFRIFLAAFSAGQTSLGKWKISEPTKTPK